MTAGESDAERERGLERRGHDGESCVVDDAGIQRLLRVGARVLETGWGGNVTLYLQDPIRTQWGRHVVLLCNVDGPDDRPATVVVKAPRDGSDLLLNEWAALAWLGEIDAVAPLVPTLFGADRDEPMIVIEDVGGGPSLQRLLQTDRSPAVGALAESQRLTAAVNAATRGRHTALAAVRATLPTGADPPVIDITAEGLLTEMHEWTTPIATDVERDVESVAATLDVPDSFLALTFHDACPVNRFVTSSGLRAVDLEMAGFRHPLLDGAYGAIGHLRCSVKRMRRDDGIGIPSDVRRLATEAYRSALVAGYPEYADRERFDADLAAASAVWMVEILRRTRPMIQRDEAPTFFGRTPRQRVLATLEVFSTLEVVTTRHAALTAWSDQLRQKLTSEWRDLPPLPHAGAFIP